MVSKNTNFSKGKGESTSSSVLDLNDFEDDLFADFNDATDESNLKKFATGFREGFLGNRHSNTQIIKRFLSNSLPSGFSRLLGSYEELKSDASEIVSNVERSSASELLSLTSKANSLLPRVKGRLPDGLYEKISGQLEGKVKDYEYSVENATPSIRKREELENKTKEDFIKEALDHSTLVNKQLFNKSEHSKTQRESRRIVESGIRDSISKKRFDFISNSLAISTDSLTKLAAYNEQVDYGLKKRTLEVQLRTLLEVRDLVKISKENLKLQDMGYKALVRNTGIPDHKKGELTELQSMSPMGIIGRLRKGSGSLSQYLLGYKDRTKKNISNTIGSRLSELVQIINAGGAIDPSMFWDQRYQIAGDLAGEGSRNLLMSLIEPELRRSLRPRIEKFSNVRLGGRHHQFDYTLDNLPSLLNEFANSGREYNFDGDFKSRTASGLRNFARDFLQPLLPSFSRDVALGVGGLENLNRQAAFNEATQKSIVDVIPGYLSRILQEIRIIRSGDPNTPREVYDVTEGRFTGLDRASKNLMSRMIRPNDISSTSYHIDEFLEQIDPESKLSDKARDALVAKIMREAANNRAFSPEAFLSKRNLDGVDDITYDEIRGHFKGLFDFDKDGKLVHDVKNLELRKVSAEKFNELKSSIKDPKELITNLVESGNSTLLREMGLIYTDAGVDKIDYSQVWNILSSNVGKDESRNAYREELRKQKAEEELASRSVFEKEKERFKGYFKRKRSEVKEKGFKEAFDEEREKLDDHIEELKTKKDQLVEALDTKKDEILDTLDAKGYTKTFSDIKDSITNYDYQGKLDQITSFDYKGQLDNAVDQIANYDYRGKAEAIRDHDYKESFNEIKDYLVNIDYKTQINQAATNTKDAITGYDYKARYDQLKTHDKHGLLEQVENFDYSAISGFRDDVERIVGDLKDRVTNYDYKGQLENKVDSTLESETVERLKTNLRSVAENSGIFDIYSPGDPNNPLAKGLDFVSGNLYDLKTKLRLTKPEDIKGTVVDGFGNVVISNLDIARGIYSPKGQKLSLSTSADRLDYNAISGFRPDPTSESVDVAHLDANETDWYIKGQSEPALTINKLKNGDYFDESGEVITDLNNLKSAVYDNMGNQLIDEADLSEGLRNKVNNKELKLEGPNRVDQGAGLINKFFRTDTTSMIFSGAQKLLGVGARLVIAGYNAVKHNRDAYLEGQEDPVLRVKSLKAGEYLDANGKPIRTFYTHKGPVYDLEGNLLVDWDEAKQLVNKDGSKHSIAKNFGLTGSVMRVHRRMMDLTFRWVPWATKKTAKFYLGALKRIPGINALADSGLAALGISTDLDAHREDRPDPVLRKSELLEGNYYNADGKVLKTFKDHKGSILDSEGNVIVSESELKLLKNPDGSKHALAKQPGLISRMLGGYVGAAGRYVRWAGSKLPFIGGLFKKRVAAKKIITDMSKATGKAPTTETLLLGEILESLRKQEPEQIRKGSWKDLMSRKKDKAKDSETEASKAKGLDKYTSGMFGALVGGIKKLFGKGKDDEESGSDYGIGDGIRDAALGDLVLRDRGGKTPKPKKVPKTRLGRLASRIGGSKIARIATSIPLLGGALKAGGAAAGAIAGAISAPVLAGAAAAVGVGYLGYKAYGHFRDKNLAKGDLKQIRMFQYGYIDPGDQLKLLELESLLEPITSKSEDPKINVGAVNMPQIMEIFGIANTEKNIDKLTDLTNYLDKRFMPVFLRHMSAKYVVGHTNTKLTDIDDKFSDEQKLEYLDIIEKDYPEHVYESIKDPLGSTLIFFSRTLKYPKSLINRRIKSLKSKLSKKPGMIGAGGKGSIDPSLALTADKPVDDMIDVKDNVREILSTKAPEPKNLARANVTNVNVAYNLEKDMGKVVKFEYTSNVPDKADGFTAIRLRAYGLETLDKDLVKRLLTLETITLQNMTFDGEEVRMRNGSNSIYDVASSLFAEHSRDRVMEWVRNRFLPVVKEIFKSIKHSKLNYRNFLSIKNPVHQLSIGRSILGTLSPHGDPIWQELNIFKINLTADDLKQLAIEELKALDNAKSDNVITTPTVGVADQVSIKERVGNFITGVADKAKSVVGSFFNRVREGFQNARDTVRQTVGLGPQGYGGHSAASAGYDAPSLTNVSTTITGGAPTSFAEMQGGTLDQIPMPSAKNGKGALPTLEAVSKITGVPLDVLYGICYVESSFNWEAKAKTSSAAGWYQFIDATWYQMLHKYSSKFGLKIPPIDPKRWKPVNSGDVGFIRDRKYDPRISALMGAMYVRENFDYLKKHLTRVPTSHDLYMGHFMGAGGARTFINNMLRNPAMAGYKAVYNISQANANATIFWDRGNRNFPRGAAEVYNLLSERFDRGVKEFHSIYGGMSIAPEEPEEVNSDEIAEPSEVTTVDPEIGGESDTNVDGAIEVGVNETPSADSAGTGEGSTTAGNTDTTSLTRTAIGNYSNPDSFSNNVSNNAAHFNTNTPTTDISEEFENSAMNMAQKRDTMRKQEIIESSEGIRNLIGIQEQQLNAVMDIRSAIFYLAKERQKSSQSDSQINQTNTPNLTVSNTNEETSPEPITKISSKYGERKPLDFDGFLALR